MANTVQINNISPYHAAVYRSGMGLGPRKFDIMVWNLDFCLGTSRSTFPDFDEGGVSRREDDGVPVNVRMRISGPRRRHLLP